MPLPSISPTEIVETLKRSSLPTVLTEGAADYHAFRKLEEGLRQFGVSFLPAGGKSAVLNVYDRRAEFSHVRVAYVVDKDLWLFSGIPAQYANEALVTTDGYSIENDLYRDGDLEGLLVHGHYLR